MFEGIAKTNTQTPKFSRGEYGQEFEGIAKTNTQTPGISTRGK